MRNEKISLTNYNKHEKEYCLGSLITKEQEEKGLSEQGSLSGWTQRELSLSE